MTPNQTQKLIDKAASLEKQLDSTYSALRNQIDFMRRDCRINVKTLANDVGENTGIVSARLTGVRPIKAAHVQAYFDELNSYED